MIRARWCADQLLDTGSGRHVRPAAYRMGLKKVPRRFCEALGAPMLAFFRNFGVSRTVPWSLWAPTLTAVADFGYIYIYIYENNSNLICEVRVQVLLACTLALTCCRQILWVKRFAYIFCDVHAFLTTASSFRSEWVYVCTVGNSRSRVIQKERSWQLISTATVLFRLRALPNSAEYPLRSLLELHTVSDTAQA